MTCPLCTGPGGRILWRDNFCRVVLADEPDYPAFCRVILNAHVKEMSDLDTASRRRLMDVVHAVETALRALLDPDKINLASLGNVVPHVHWHVIPRYADDAHFPDPVWAAPRRTGQQHSTEKLEEKLAAALRQRLSAPQGKE